MILKDGVKIANMKPQLILGIMCAMDIYRKHGQELVITSLDDSVHGKDTLHGQGLAVDFRTNYFIPEEAKKVCYEISIRLGKDFDVVLEKDHIHLEYDVK